MKPSTEAVRAHLWDAGDDGMCFLDFARLPKPIPPAAARSRVAELVNQGELQGEWIDKSPCKRHRHDGRAIRYTLRDYGEGSL